MDEDDDEWWGNWEKERKFNVDHTTTCNKSFVVVFLLSTNTENHYFFMMKTSQGRGMDAWSILFHSSRRLHRSSFVVLCNSKWLLKEKKIFFVVFRCVAFNLHTKFSFKISSRIFRLVDYWRVNTCVNCKVEIESWWCRYRLH